MRQSVDEVRTRERIRQLNRRHAEKLIRIPHCADRKRREDLEQDDVAWLRWYFGECDGCEAPFTYPFTGDQLEIAAAIRHAMLTGDDQAIADSRGGGKTTFAERLLLKHTLTGVLDFSMLLQATGKLAENSLEDIRASVQYNERLCEDYPEVCVPVRDVIGAPQKAKSQIVSGDRHDTGEPYEMAQTEFSWSGQEIVFPRVPGSPSAGAIIGTRGTDAAIRGLKSRGKRPKLVVMDDLDTDDTARSRDQAEKLEDRIERAIGGLGGQKHRCGRVMLCTVPSRVSVAWTYCDHGKKPSFKAKRFRFLIKPPDKMELWEEYMGLLKRDWLENTTCAHELYVANRAAMDAGAIIANPNRFVTGELSALQFYFNEWARKGEKYCQTELNNEPPKDDEPQESGLTPSLVASRLSGYAVKIVPQACQALTAAIDIRMRELHWCVVAWLTGAVGMVIERGRSKLDVLDDKGDEKQGKALEQAIVEGLHAWRSAIQGDPYTLEDGEIRPLDSVWIDTGYQDEAVYQFIRDVGGRPYWPAKGFGKSRKGMSPFSLGQASSTRQIGEHMFLAQQQNGLWLFGFDADYWKRWVHQRFLTPTRDEGGNFRQGSLSLYGTEYSKEDRRRSEMEHARFAEHICSEIETQVTLPNRAVEMRWVPKSKHNHWLDTTVMASAAAWSMGVRLLGAVPQQEPQKRNAVISAGISRPEGRMW